MSEDKLILQIKRIRPELDADLPLPQYMTANSAGMDIYAAVSKPIKLEAGTIKLIPTGLAMALPPNFEAQLRPRSGLAVKHGITLINAPGTIDADYRGEIMVGLINAGQNMFMVTRGQRIAQMIINRVFRPLVQLVENLDQTVRGHGGFGHTG